ncbi:glycoside hydrolase family 5 protein [Brachybacterium paraconglomeratum]
MRTTDEPRTGPAEYYRREGASILAPSGRPTFRRGMGLGGWLLPEGYMWDLEGPVDSPLRMEAMVQDLLGPNAAEDFWARYRAAFIAREDIAAIAAAGFDHVRLPLNSRQLFDGESLLPDGIAHVDDTLAWCRAEGIGCVLDLHGAPGGQTGANIDDSPHRLPELFTDPERRAQGLRLWRLLAERYADDTAVIAYDLLNEPLPEEHHALVPRLAEFYRDVIAEIRAVDPHHLLSVEGWHWATRFQGLERDWEANSCLHFHKYWSQPTTESLRPYLDLREQLGIPLWMGESGENDDAWYTEAFTLFEQHAIPWTFWTWKKVDRSTSPMVVGRPDRWDRLVAHAAGRGPVPERPDEILEQLLEDLPLSRCTRRLEVLEALPGITAAPVTTPSSEGGAR